MLGAGDSWVHAWLVHCLGLILASMHRKVPLDVPVRATACSLSSLSGATAPPFFFGSTNATASSPSLSLPSV